MTDDSQTQTSAKTKIERRKPLWVYVKECAAHLLLGIRALWPLLIGIFALVAVWFILLNLGCQEKDIRWLGMLLQLGGVLTVAKGLRDSGRLFKKMSAVDKIALFFKEFPRRRVRIHTGSVRSVAPAMTVRGRATCLPGPNTPLERRVELLEARTKDLFSEVGKLEKKLSAQSDELTLKITEEVTQIKAEHRALEEQLERAVIGGIHVEWWGVLLFIVGIILASASPELASSLWKFGICGQ